MTELKQQEKDNQLFKAVQKGDIEAIVTAHAAGANINALEERDRRTKNESRTPLLLAVERGHLEACQKLLELGAQVDLRSSLGNTPLMKAAVKNKDTICELLIEHKANLEIKNDSDDTALILATSSNSLSSALMLIKHGANIHAQESSGNTPLILAAGHGNSEICRSLLERGADTELANHVGTTALMRAAQWDYKDTCQLLLDYGAYTETSDNVGDTAIYFAAEHQRANAGHCLLRAGAKPVKSNSVQSGWLETMRTGVAVFFPNHISPSRNVCFTHNGISEALLDACATGQFVTRVAAPLITSKNPEDRKLFQEIWDKLPPYWQRTYAATHVAFVRTEREKSPFRSGKNDQPTVIAR